MLDVIPLACTLWDASFAIIDCNQEAIHLLGFPIARNSSIDFLLIYPPEYQPDGQRSMIRL